MGGCSRAGKPGGLAVPGGGGGPGRRKASDNGRGEQTEGRKGGDASAGHPREMQPLEAEESSTTICVTEVKAIDSSFLGPYINSCRAPTGDAASRGGGAPAGPAPAPRCPRSPGCCPCGPCAWDDGGRGVWGCAALCARSAGRYQAGPKRPNLCTRSKGQRIASIHSYLRAPRLG